MIVLKKAAEPRILITKKVEWTQEILDILAKDEKPTKTQKTRYNHREIKSAIVAETHGKCAYCESQITHIDHGDIEHLVPKSKVPARAFEWVNLTLACRKCNQNKGDFHGGANDHSGLVDPYIDIPEDHFLFMRELVIARPDSARGIITDSEIKISRLELVEKRRERMEFIDGLVTGYLNAPNELKPILLQDIYDKCTSPKREFTAVGTHYLSKLVTLNILPVP